MSDSLARDNVIWTQVTEYLFLDQTHLIHQEFGKYDSLADHDLILQYHTFRNFERSGTFIYCTKKYIIRIVYIRIVYIRIVYIRIVQFYNFLVEENSILPQDERK